MKIEQFPRFPSEVGQLVRKLTDLFRSVAVEGAGVSGGNRYTGTQAVNWVTLTDAATITTDGALGNNFVVTLGGNRILANPTNLVDGAIYQWEVNQDGTGSRTITSYGSKFKWPAGTVPTLSTAASAVDLIVGQYRLASDRILAVCTKGFA